MKYRQALTEAGLCLLPSLDLLLDGMWVQRLLTSCVGVRSGKSRCLFREEETLLVTTCVPILQKGEGGTFVTISLKTVGVKDSSYIAAVSGSTTKCPTRDPLPRRVVSLNKKRKKTKHLPG